MAKLIIILFFLSTGFGSYYLTYHSIGQEEVVTVEKYNVRSSSSYGRSSGGSYGSSSGGYSYGK
ncbi:MAG: hypothetical protein K0U38_04475 [Epsilonproteobacteria bacterium]|nr:hypothetical protein [Campylobacterota bacterium]